MPDVIVTTQNTPINIEIGGPSTPTSNEVDPTVPVHVKAITQEDIDNWNSNSSGDEATIRAAADTLLQENIDDEATIRAASDTALQTNIDAEALARQAADTDLELSFESFAETLNTEESERTYADSSLQSAIDGEVTNRTNADITLQGNIDAESIARADADATLQSNIDAEIIAREDSDIILQGNIDSEAIIRADADAVLNGAISQEFIDRINADILLQGNISAKEPTITGSLVTEFWSGLKTWRSLAADVRAVVLTGLSLVTSSVISASDTVLSSLGKLQAQITTNLTTLTNHTSNTSNPHATTKSQVGLGNADDTSDVNKPVSTAQQAEINKLRDISFYRRPGVWHTPSISPFTSAAATSANTIFFIPFIVTTALTITDIGYNVAATGTTTLARCGIYSSNANREPDALLADSGNLGVGIGAKSVTLVTPIVLQPGLYFTAYLQNGTGTVTGTSNLSIANIFGNSTIVATSNNGYSKAVTYGALPNPVTALSNASGTLPFAYFRIT
jgi:hypothetical protein